MRGETRLVVQARVDGEESSVPRLDVDLALSDGITTVMGASGAGKSTLLTTIAGLVIPDRGRVVLDGAALFDSKARVMMPPHRRRVALVFQSLGLFPHLSVWENVAYGVRNARRDTRRKIAQTWLDRCRAGELADRFPGALSGGEAQRVALARSLASEPRVLLLDEPFSALDVELRRSIGELVRELVIELKIPALLVTHHRDDVSRLGDRLITLERGCVAADQPVDRHGN